MSTPKTKTVLGTTRKPFTQAEVFYEFSTKGVITHAGDADTAVYQARYIENNYRKAEVLVDQTEASAMETLKVKLNRAKFAEAKLHLESAEQQASTPNAINDVLLEKARIAYFEGKYLAANDFCRQLIEPGCDAMNFMAALQVRATSRYELGQYSECLQDIQHYRTYESIYPNTENSFYCAMLESKVHLILGHIEHGRTLLDRAWTRLKKNEFQNPNWLHAMVRAEIEFSRITGRCARNWSFLSLALAIEIGDDLFKPICLMDLYFAAPELQAIIQPGLFAARADHHRLDRMISETLTARPFSARPSEISTTPWLISRTVAIAAENMSDDLKNAFATLPVQETLECWNELTSYTFLIPSQNVCVGFSPLKVYDLSESPQLMKASDLLAAGPLSKQSFFHALWGQQKFSTELHDPLIRNLLKRLRKIDTLQIQSAKSILHIKNGVRIA